ncbi:glutamate--cysteine ligase [Photobacterium kasasachensis]|uniref:glutamate--cysteine ligase n=1 Tax=Photobacterium kasasachensis TaxID=2910240 RepID=UPI003D0B53E4
MKSTEVKNIEVKHSEINMISFLNKEDVRTSLIDIRRGIERELVRTTSQGLYSEQPHPKPLGSALIHPYITTDFAEAQLELVTPAMNDRQATFEMLGSLHHFVATHMPSNETMWGASMPPVLPNEEAITIADYGTSNAGKLKMRYRHGLANRYGKRMQLISGIHYNFSLPESFWKALHSHTQSPLSLSEFIAERYFHLIRNVIRHGWVIPYLFGASPAVDHSYIASNEHELEKLDDDTFYLPWATSLRLSNMGYSSSEQSSYPMSFNNKQEYLIDLCRALTKPSERYTHLNADKQLNASVLQLENELYGSVRPKIVSEEQRPLMAMCHHGVQYIELRSLDNNPYLPLGISEEQSHFLDLFLTYSALASSSDITDEERALIVRRQELVATQGRKPGLMLPTLQGELPLTELGEELLTAMKPVADMFDSAFATDFYAENVEREKAKFSNSDLTPSAKVLADMNKGHLSHTAFVQQLSNVHMKEHVGRQIDPEEMEKLIKLAAESQLAQAQMEAQQEASFEEFIQQKNRLQCDCEHQEAAV